MALRKEEIGVNDNSRRHCKFPITTLKFIRAVTPGNVKGEIWDDAFEVSLEEVFSALCVEKSVDIQTRNKQKR